MTIERADSDPGRENPERTVQLGHTPPTGQDTKGADQDSRFTVDNMRLAWTTDIHLNFVDGTKRRSFLTSLARDADAVVITGDIGESADVCDYLREIETALQRPIYFVLGNHDFYRGSIVETQQAVKRLAAESQYLVYLTTSGVVKLTPRTALMGHDGWADGRLGDFEHSDVILNDYALIKELQWWQRGFLDKRNLGAKLHALGDEAAENLKGKLLQATEQHGNAIVATHVPPFREATWHEGRVSDDNWLPHFSCKAVGDALLKTMKSRPDADLLVLCGHTHGAGEANLLPNLRVLTGGATYGAPAVQCVIEVA